MKRTIKQEKYQPQKIEQKWQKIWKEKKLYAFMLDEERKSYYNLVELPYPSGDLHLGHWFSFVTADVHARMKQMQGYNVFFPNGFDAFGLPAENAAIKRGIHPQDWTLSNIDTMKKQFATMGTMIDWSHEAITCVPEYYRWNQWIFIKMFEKGIAYRGKALSNWCPKDQTVLANEHIEAGKCWRCGTEVIQKEIEQWFLKITSYADRLLWSEHPSVDWPQSVREGQNNWIGKKEGMTITHKVVGMNLEFETFTAFPAWSWADTYIVIAPEHPLVKQLVKGTDKEKEVMNFVEETAKITSSDRNEDKFEKKGIFTGRYAKDPFGGEDMPIWLANFALINFGTGIIRCSGHDPRDVEFAKKYGINIKEVVDRVNPHEPVNAHTNKGILKNSGPFTGKEVSQVIPQVIDWIEKQKIGKRHVNYHLHDWSISRQRYWGTPVPMIHCPKCGIIPVPFEQLPIELPYDVDFTPKGEPPLASNKEWLTTTCPKCGGKAQRDAETLDTFFDSSWYYYRYLDPHFEKGAFDTQMAKKMMPLDIYFGGAEHTLGHTLYARFFTKFFHDLGLITFEEFAKRRVQHGVILGPDGNRMSKSKGNVVNPDDVVKDYGTDAVRLYLSFMMPYDATAPWNPKGIWGVYRFLKRVWDIQYRVGKDKNVSLSNDNLYQMHHAIKKVSEDVAGTKFNTAVSTLMIWLNYLESKETVSDEEYKNLLLLLAPFAPHMSEEIWQLTMLNDNGKENAFRSIHQEKLPVPDSRFLIESTVTIVVQVNGKVRDNIQFDTVSSSNQKIVEEEAQKSHNVKKYLEGKKLEKVIYIRGKIINFVLQNG